MKTTIGKGGLRHEAPVSGQEIQGRAEEKVMRRIITIAWLLVFVATLPVYAQEDPLPVDLQALPEEIAAQFDGRLEAIDDLKAQVVKLRERLEGGEGLQATIFAARLETVRTQLFVVMLNHAKDVARQEESGFNVSEFKAALIDDLRLFPDQAAEAMFRLAQAIDFNYADMGPTDTVINDKRLLIATSRVDAILDTLITYTEVAANMGLDASAQVEFLEDGLADAAANRSVFLEVAIAQVGLTRSTAATLPNDEELPAWVSAA